MKKTELFKKYLLFQILSFLALLTFSLFPIFEHSYSWYSNYYHSTFYYYDITNIFGIIFGGKSYYVDSLLVFFLYLVFITLLGNFVLIFFNAFKVKQYNGFPSIKDAKTYYQELKKVKIAQDKLADKFRIEKAKTEFNNKMAKLEEEKKKYF
jgi:hypothetical protein